jgi:hypothetical protein
MIDSTSVRVHQHAANSKKVTRIAVWAARAVSNGKQSGPRIGMQKGL